MNNKRVALLATGDEITNGDILNTNGQRIAQTLFEQGIEVGMHLVASDRQSDIENAMSYLLQHHDALIITGGLGPTSDDRTRFALANAVKKELIFDEQSWENILQRFKRYNLQNQPESNRHQALFPQGATIIKNDNGSAAGCWLIHENKLIFMLPGPPNECLPMFNQIVFPILIDHHFQQPIIQKKWLLFNVSEGEIAEKLDKIAANHQIATGYRIRYPYVEFKARSSDIKMMDIFIQNAKTLLESHLINSQSQPASEILIETLVKYPNKISIEDLATRGTLAKTLTTVMTYEKIIFGARSPDAKFHIQISGLQDFWQNTQNLIQTEIIIQHESDQKTFAIPYRGERTLLYAVELISQQILQLLSP